MSRRVADDLGRVVELPDTPARVVSLVPSVTEVVCALGCADRLVGVTRYCTHPPEVVSRLPRIGGTKNPDCDEIVALHPDVVLVNAEENRREDFEHLTACGISVFASFPRTVAESARSIERVSDALGTLTTGLHLAQAIDAARAASVATVRRRTKVFCPIWRTPWMSVNRDTFVHDLLACAGGDNVCAAGSDRYPVVALEDIARAAPEVILLPDEPYHFRERDRAHLAPLAATPAWREQRVHFVDGRALSWYGPRTPAALSHFRHLIDR